MKNIAYLFIVQICAGINADLFVLPKNVFGGDNEENQCFNEGNDKYKAEDGLQNISPCQYGNYSTNTNHSYAIFILIFFVMQQVLQCIFQIHTFINRIQNS